MQEIWMGMCSNFSFWRISDCKDNGSFSSYFFQTANQRGIGENEERIFGDKIMEKWMMNDADIFDITENCFCKDPVCEKCDREIGNKSQRKLLEYLILNDSDRKSSDKEWYMRPNNRIVLEAMLKQLEEKRGEL
jgi:hypothetical protein